MDENDGIEESDQTAKGACLCGEVQFEVSLPTLWCGHCHCTQCQRYHGAPLVTWVGVSQDQFQVTQGEHKLSWHASSAPARRGFCGECGSSFLFQSEKWPGEMHISLPNFKDPIDREPEGHTHFDTHCSWLALNDDLPRKI